VVCFNLKIIIKYNNIMIVNYVWLVWWVNKKIDRKVERDKKNIKVEGEIRE
jgi:hypothetical protein